MAESMLAQANKIESLTDDNYYVRALKVSAILRNRKLYKEIIEGEEPALTAGAVREAWEAKNNEAFGIIILTLSSEQAGQFIGETNAKTVWRQLETRYAGNIKDRKIDIGLELKNIKMEINETIKAYITRARNIASRSASLGKTISTREIVYHVVRGISYKLEKVGSVLRAQKGLSLEEVEQILSEKETRQTKDGDIKYYTNKGKDEKAYKMTGNYKKKNSSGCFVAEPITWRNNVIIDKTRVIITAKEETKEGKLQAEEEETDTANTEQIRQRRTEMNILIVHIEIKPKKTKNTHGR